ncbi:DUF862 domain-containing protein [Citrus sinensis]|uniref:DUF862 domain-containing protein n=1 Tax=Citrus sinensis TaxID=2711 RepID=A0ACB8MX16_CITSI|nr:DUF862 domain-containing protein [Citrus sinensis]KAH9789670.1 DUF862 domain-containing protein [Citrus sinensis]
MDINKDHAAIDIKLAETLSKKFKTLHYPSSKECCIYRVPQSQRCLNPSDYTPHIVSIGPLHHGNEELKAMEDNKLRYLHHFLQRTKDSSFLPIGDTNLIDTHFSKAKHFLDLIILCLRPSSQSRDKRRFNYQNIPGIKELHQAGVQFDSGRGRSQSRLHITFENGRLIIPSFTAFGGRTERLYRNILTFENMQGYPRYFNDYVALLCFLIRTPKDADLLIQNGIIGLGDSERMSSVLQSLKKSCIMGSDFQYANVVTDLLHYCKLEWHGWTATLKQNYFNTPWASISVIAGVILLILTVVQTVCALIAL